MHFKLPPAIVFVSSCPASESHNMFQSRYRETIVQILIHCFCCGSSCFLYFYIQFLTDSDVFFNVVVWTDIFLVFLFFFRKLRMDVLPATGTLLMLKSMNLTFSWSPRGEWFLWGVFFTLFCLFSSVQESVLLEIMTKSWDMVQMMHNFFFSNQFGC